MACFWFELGRRVRCGEVQGLPLAFTRRRGGRRRRWGRPRDDNDDDDDPPFGMTGKHCPSGFCRPLSVICPFWVKSPSGYAGLSPGLRAECYSRLVLRRDKRSAIKSGLYMKVSAGFLGMRTHNFERPIRFSPAVPALPLTRTNLLSPSDIHLMPVTWAISTRIRLESFLNPVPISPQFQPQAITAVDAHTAQG